MGTMICTHSFLREKHYPEQLAFAFTCNGCGETGYGSCYTCTDSCNYHLHQACQNAPTKMYHPFYQQVPFVLDKSTIFPPTNYHEGLANFCAACGKIVQGWRYVSTTNNGSYAIVIHPCCMQLPHQTLHPMLENASCICCQSIERVGNERVQGWAYVKQGGSLHVQCLKDMVHKDWERRYQSRDHGQENHTHGTQERGFGHGPANYQGGRRRKRDYFMNGLGWFVQGLSIFATLGLVDLGPIMDKLKDFVGITSVWGNQGFDPSSYS